MEVCNQGACAASCSAGLAKCEDSCVDLTSDPHNCGFCAEVCGMGLVCTNSQCACASGTTDCAGECVDTQTSAENCGTCGVACPAGTTCTGGHCG
jgi:hypothetical protein